VTAGQYCVLPVDQGATLTYNPSYGSSNFTPSPGADTYAYAWTGQLAQVNDPAGDYLHITYDSPAPGSGDWPSSATSCQTVTAASGRALVIGSNCTPMRAKLSADRLAGSADERASGAVPPSAVSRS
jgi:hypothetical protein